QELAAYVQQRFALTPDHVDQLASSVLCIQSLGRIAVTLRLPAAVMMINRMIDAATERLISRKNERNMDGLARTMYAVIVLAASVPLIPASNAQRLAVLVTHAVLPRPAEMSVEERYALHTFAVNNTV